MSIFSFRAELATGGGCKWNFSEFRCQFFPFGGGGQIQIKIMSSAGVNSRPATRQPKHTVGHGGHFTCRRGVSYNGKNTKFTIKRFPSNPGGHFLEARRAFFCPRAAGVRNPGLHDSYLNSFSIGLHDSYLTIALL